MELITVSSIKEIDMSDLSLPLIVMYDHPLDYPDYIVARVWEGKYAAPTNTAILYKNISEAERELDIYQKVPRHPGDKRVRAERRALELREKGEECDIDEVMKNLEERDYMDSHREISPLTKAEDAITLDNTEMTFDDQMAWVGAILKDKFNLMPSVKESRD